MLFCVRRLLFGAVLACCLHPWSCLYAAPELRFDVVTFCCGCAPDSSLCQDQFDHLNFPTLNGHFIAMGSDTHRFELGTNGNALAVYYNTFNEDWPSNSAAVAASNINQYALGNFTSNGPRPDWIVLNEISSGTWPVNASYRAWVRDTVHALRAVYGFKVMLYSPFPNPAGNASDWQALGQDGWIAIENYLSGAEVQSHGYSMSYCQGQYQSSISSYTSLGVPVNRLILGEHFAQTAAGMSYGRSGIASNDWDTVIPIRDAAIRNAAFAGFIGYGWSKNAMLVSDPELLHFEDTYAADALPSAATLSAPAVIIQPASQSVPEGSDVSFLVFQAGTAPTTFQWRKSGADIPGATNSSLNLTNVGTSDIASYSVLLTNAAGMTLSSNAFLAIQTPPPAAFEPFAASQTLYAPGANLIGQTNAAGQRWSAAGPASANQPIIQSGNLFAPGLMGPSGNSVRFGGNGLSARFNLGTNAASGSWFYSMLFRLKDISSLSPSGVFWAGFNNSSGSQSTTPTSVATRLVARAAAGGFNIGLDKTSGRTPAIVFSPAVFSTNDLIFIVGAYTFNSGSATDDVSQLWINPPVSTFGLASPPPADLVSTATNDIPSSSIESFVLFNRSTAEPDEILADEIRIGPSWASVTTPAEFSAAPALNIARDGEASVLSWGTNAPGFILQSAAALGVPSAWIDLSAPVSVFGGNFVVTNSAADPAAFYRLRQPR